MISIEDRQATSRLMVATITTNSLVTKVTTSYVAEIITTYLMAELAVINSLVIKVMTSLSLGATAQAVEDQAGLIMSTAVKTTTR